MNTPFLKTTVASVALVVGGLISACANSGDRYVKEIPRQVTNPVKVLTLSPVAAKELKFSENELAVVFAMDREGNIQAFTEEGNKWAVMGYPLKAGEITQMNTITTFQTSNPKTCWLSFGYQTCITW